MKSTFLSTALAGLWFMAGAEAFVCGHTYYMQSIEETLLSGLDVTALTVQSRTKVNESLAGAAILFDSTEYKILTQFEAPAACNDWSKVNAKVASRKKGEKQFASAASSEFFLIWSSGPFPYAIPKTPDYWFGFSTGKVGDAYGLDAGVVKGKDESGLHIYYANTIVVKQKINPISGAPDGPPTTAFYRTIANSPDSATLLADLFKALDSSKSTALNQLTFKAQVLKVTFDSIPPDPSAIGYLARAKPRNAGFAARQVGNLVFIQPGTKAGQNQSALGLFDMMGTRVASLHPMGYNYQWNGKTQSGSEASPGVYFIQAGNEVLGKFFYSRQ